MSNIITIELCAEDRARLDRLAEALERKACEKCVASALEAYGPAEAQKRPTEMDPVQKKFAEALTKAENPKLVITKLKEGDPGYTPHAEKPTESTGAPTAEAAPIDHPAEEDLPWEAAAPAEEAKPTVTQDQLQQKVMQLAAANNGALKAKVREIVNAYAKKVSDVPEDKRAEVWDKLTTLEKGGQA